MEGDWSRLLPRCEGCGEPAMVLFYVHGKQFCQRCSREIAVSENWRESYKWK